MTANYTSNSCIFWCLIFIINQLFLIAIYIKSKQGDCSTAGASTSKCKSTSEAPLTRVTSSKRHVKTVKINICVAVLFLLSYVGPMLYQLRIVSSYNVNYVLFFNHIGNPFIYIWLDNKFREKVHVMFKSLFCWDSTASTQNQHRTWAAEVNICRNIRNRNRRISI